MKKCLMSPQEVGARLCAAAVFRWLFLGRAIFYQIEMKDTAGLAVIIYEASTSEASGPKGRQAPSTSTSEH